MTPPAGRIRLRVWCLAAAVLAAAAAAKYSQNRHREAVRRDWLPSSWGLAPEQGAFHVGEQIRGGVYGLALWVSVGAVSLSVLAELGFDGSRGAAVRAWRGPFAELAFAAAAAGLLAYWLAPDAPDQFRRMGLIRDERLQGHFWLLGGSLLLVWLFRARPRPTTEPRCGACGYNLTANESGVCPECGTPVRPPRSGAEAARP